MANLTRLPKPLFESYEWQERGACRDEPAETFFVPENLSKAERLRSERQAKMLCARCPVSQQCLDHALSVREPFGVWGGLTASERKGMLRGERAS